MTTIAEFDDAPVTLQRRETDRLRSELSAARALLDHAVAFEFDDRHRIEVGLGGRWTLTRSGRLVRCYDTRDEAVDGARESQKCEKARYPEEGSGPGGGGVVGG